MSAPDLATLDVIFNSGGQLGATTRKTRLAPIDPPSFNNSTNHGDLLVKAKQEEAKAMILAQNQKYNEANDVLSQLIHSHPDYPSAYNNRAQVMSSLHQYQETMSDLDTCITLSRKYHNDEVLALSLTQRAMIRTIMNGDKDMSDPLAHADFKEAAVLGNVYAKQALARDNPYAKMCSAIVQQLI